MLVIGYVAHVQVWLCEPQQPARPVQARPSQHALHTQPGPNPIQLCASEHAVLCTV